MSNDVLIQSGMGSIDAPRTEEYFRMRALVARSGNPSVKMPVRAIRAFATRLGVAMVPT